MHIKKASSIAALITLAACGNSGADELRVGFTNECPISGVSARESALGAIGVALLADFGGRLVGGLIDQIASAMAEDKVLSFRGTGRMQGFYNKRAGEKGELLLNKSEGCLMIALGEFGVAPPTQNPFPKDGHPPSSEDVNAIAGKLGAIKSPLKFYVEGVFEPSKDRTAFAFIPTYVYYPEFVNEGNIFSSSRRDFLVTIEWSAPGAAAFGTAQLVWAGVRKTGQGVVIARQAELEALQTEWIKLPPFTAGAAESGEFGATNVKVLVSETAKPHTIAKYFGEALKGQKDQITTLTKDAITQSVSTEARLEAKLKLTEAAQTASTAYVTAYDDAQKAFDAWNDEKDATAKPAKLNAARLAYQRVPTTEQLARRAYSNAGLPFESRPPLKPLP